MIKNDLSIPPCPRLEEEQLVAAARYDPHAFGALYDHYLTPVYRYLVSRVGNHHDAEDLTSQVFLTVMERFSQFRNPNSSFAAWLFTIARNKSIDFFRRSRPETDLLPEHPALVDEDLSALVTQQDDARTIQKIIAALPLDDREVLDLRFAAQMTFPEIAQLLGRKEGAVKKQVYRLLEKIGEKLEVQHE